MVKRMTTILIEERVRVWLKDKKIGFGDCFALGALLCQSAIDTGANPDGYVEGLESKRVVLGQLYSFLYKSHPEILNEWNDSRRVEQARIEGGD